MRIWLIIQQQPVSTCSKSEINWGQDKLGTVYAITELQLDETILGREKSVLDNRSIRGELSNRVYCPQIKGPRIKNCHRERCVAISSE